MSSKHSGMIFLLQKRSNKDTLFIGQERAVFAHFLGWPRSTRGCRRALGSLRGGESAGTWRERLEASSWVWSRRKEPSD